MHQNREWDGAWRTWRQGLAGVRTTGAPSWVSVTLSLSTLTLEASRDAWAEAAPGPGEMHPWSYEVALEMLGV